MAQKYFFRGYSQWLKINQNSPNRGLSSNLCWLRGANYVKYTEECAICMEKLVLVKRCL